MKKSLSGGEHIALYGQFMAIDFASGENLQTLNSTNFWFELHECQVFMSGLRV